MNDTMGFGKDQVKLFVRQLRKELGSGWDYFTTDVREAFVARKAFDVIRGQNQESIPVDVMDKLYQAMLVESGLSGPEDCTCGGTGDGTGNAGLCGARRGT